MPPEVSSLHTHHITPHIQSRMRLYSGLWGPRGCPPVAHQLPKPSEHSSSARVASIQSRPFERCSSTTFFSTSHTPQAAAQGTLIASAISLVFPPLLQPQPEASPAASTAGRVAENPPAASVIRGGKRPSRSSSGCSRHGGQAIASLPPCTGRPLAEP